MSTYIRPTVLILAAVASVGARAADLPRYHFQPGQELNYEADSTFKEESGVANGSKDAWTAWVLRKNGDGSHRLLFRKSSRWRDSRQTTPSDPEVTLGYADVFDDGRIVANPSLAYYLDPSAILPLLPGDDAATAAGWERQDVFLGESTSYRKIDAQADVGAFSFESNLVSPFNKVYLKLRRSLIRFDLRKGLVEEIQTETTRGYGSVGRGTEVLALKSVGAVEASWIKDVTDDLEVYFDAARRHEELCDRAGNGEGDIDASFAQAGAMLEAAAGKLRTDQFREGIKGKVAQHRGTLGFDAPNAKDRAVILGKPAPGWEAQDLDGKTHTLKDYRGKVVVLDFWHRGCGWCIRSMPQMKLLIDDFRGRPVVILGANIDPDEKDARLVVQAMGLNYPNLKAAGLLADYHVHGCPTLIVIDPAGKVAALHVGYTPTLRADVSKVVEGLLKADAGASTAR